jgi:hypothetical protein
MKSILQPIVLASAVLLIASCDSGGAGGISNIGVTPPAPQNGLTGSAVKGVITGGTITVADSAGANVPLASGGTTGADGSYNLVFTQAAIAAGISAPLVVTITGGAGTSMVCDIDLGTVAAPNLNDCAVGDGTFVAFGESYPLPADFMMRGIVSTIPSAGSQGNVTATVNLSPASDLATDLALTAAAGSALTVAEVDAAGAQVLGLIQTITGTDLTGLTLNEIAIPNIANGAATAGASDASQAIAAFSAAIIANQGATETVAAVIARINASLRSNAATGNLTATGTALASLTSSVQTALRTVAAQVTAGGGNSAKALAAVNNARLIEAVYVAMGTAAVQVSSLPPVGSTSAVAQTKAFVNKFNTVISTALATTGGGGVGVDDLGATEVFATELDAITKLNSGAASSAAQALQTAVKAQAAAMTANGTVAFTNMNTTNPVSFSITRTGTVYTLENVSSRWTSMAGTPAETTVLITATSGSSSGNDIFSLAGVSMVTTTPAATTGGDPVVAQTFTGGTISGTGTVTTFIGTVTGTSATTSFGVNVVYTDPVNMLGGDSFVATVSFASETADNLSATFSGTVGALTQSLSITAGSNTIAITATRNGVNETVTFSDGPVMMIVNLVSSVVVSDQSGNIATLNVTGTAAATGTIAANGTITYSDGSFQSLPAGIF